MHVSVLDGVTIHKVPWDKFNTMKFSFSLSVKIFAIELKPDFVKDALLRGKVASLVLLKVVDFSLISCSLR